ncbi:MAG: CoA-binding protein, partial [Thermoplasmata archaeon]
MKGTLEPLFRPKTVALIGASANPTKLSYTELENLSKGGFRLYPVNPKETEILGLRCYPSVLDIPDEIDLVVVSLPAKSSVEVTKECVQKGVKMIIVTSSGFKESGHEGAQLEQALVGSIRDTPTRILGPNTMGIYVPSTGLDTLFIPREKSARPGAGPIAMLSQSGAVSVSFLEKAAASGVGISACVGLGNKCNIDENELLQYLSKDAETRCAALYLESFSDGRKFLDT